MAADRQESTSETETDARMQIQEIIEDLTRKLACCVYLKYFETFTLHVVFTEEELNLTEPGNRTLDGKIDLLDKIFTECKVPQCNFR